MTVEEIVVRAQEERDRRPSMHAYTSSSGLAMIGKQLIRKDPEND